MFVSSYSTYIDTNATKRVTQDKSENKKDYSDSFSSKTLQTDPQESVIESKLPINYISNYKSLYNRQQFQEQTESKTNKAQMKFTKVNSMSSAKVAYGENTKMYSLMQKPKQVIDQTPKLGKNLPNEAKSSQESVMRVKMVNAYISNDNYYRITSAA